MEDNDLDIDICKYELLEIINNERKVIAVGNDLEAITIMYSNIVEKYHNKTTKDHVIITLFDYDKAININYYDNEIDIC